MAIMYFNEVFSLLIYHIYIQKHNMLSSVRMLQKKVQGFFPNSGQ